MPLATLDRETTTVLDEEYEFPPLCESDHCQICDRGVHEAKYVATLDCGFRYQICEVRYVEYPIDQFIRCDHPTNHTVYWEDITVVPL